MSRTAAVIVAAAFAGNAVALDFWWSKPHTWRYNRATPNGYYQTHWRSWEEWQGPATAPMEVEIPVEQNAGPTKYQAQRATPAAKAPMLADPLRRTTTPITISRKGQPAGVPAAPPAVIQASFTVSDDEDALIQLPPAKR